MLEKRTDSRTVERYVRAVLTPRGCLCLDRLVEGDSGVKEGKKKTKCRKSREGKRDSMKKKKKKTIMGREENSWKFE